MWNFLFILFLALCLKLQINSQRICSPFLERPTFALQNDCSWLNCLRQSHSSAWGVEQTALLAVNKASQIWNHACARSQWEIIQTANTWAAEMPFVPRNRGHFMGRTLIPLLVCSWGNVIPNYLTRLLEHEKNSAFELCMGGFMW